MIQLRRSIWLIVSAALIGLLSLGACSSGGDTTSTFPPPVSTTTESSAQQSADAAAQASQDATEQKEADNKASAVEAQARSAGTPEARMSVIITAYCTIQRDPTSVDEDEMIDLEQFYDTTPGFWQAGAHWPYPLSAALQQSDACPTPAASLPQQGG